MSVKEILDAYKTIAVVGMSKHPMKPAHSVPAFMMKQGYRIIPVNPTTDSILNLKSYKTLSEVPDEIDIVNVFRPSEDCLEIITEAVKRHKERGDVRVIWLQEGIFSNEGRIISEANGIEFLEDHCMYKDYVLLDVED